MPQKSTSAERLFQIPIFQASQQISFIGSFYDYILPKIFQIIKKKKLPRQKAGLEKIRYRRAGRSKVRTLSGLILPHFVINNFSVAQKLTKLDSLVLVQIKLALIIALMSHKVC